MVINYVVSGMRGNEMPWKKMTTEDKVTIIVVALIGLLIISVVNLIAFGIL